MLPDQPTSLTACLQSLRVWHGPTALGFLALLLCPMAVKAQDAATPPVPSASSQSGEERQIAFEADAVAYSDDNQIVTASGNVVLRSEGQSVRADAVTWNRDSGQIAATGNVRLVDADGNQLFTEQVELTEELKAGAMQNLLMALREGGRLAAQSGSRSDTGGITLTNASYTGCEIEDADGCPRKPSWRVTAEQVDFDPVGKTIRFRGARLEMFGLPLMPLPGLVITSDGHAISGILVPDVRFTPSNGIELNGTY